jgi:organic radical activating enzyme
MIKLEKKYIPKDELSNIEIHISNSCNLTCDSCSHYSNHGHKGILSIEDFEDWVLPWSKKIKPTWFSLMGGEPTLNKNLVEIAKKSVNIWSDSRIRIISNGFFLKNHLKLPEIIKQYKIQLRLSIHHDSDEYKEKIKPVRDLINEWSTKYNLSVSNKLLPVSECWKEADIVWTTSYGKGWRQTYKGFGDNMMPFEDNNPKESWKKCSVKNCRQIFLGKLWKCPNLAYLQMQDKKFKLNEKWTPYLSYRDGNLKDQAIENTASYKEIKNFYETEEIFHCNMCPASYNEHPNLPSPLISISDLINKKI